MTTFAAKIADAWTVLPVGQPVTLNEISVSWETLMLWSDEEREAFGVFSVWDPDVPPSGKVEASRALKPDGERPEWVVAYVDAPPPAPLRCQIAKADIWRRATDAEAERMDAALNAAPVRLRRAYDAAQFIASDDEWFGELRAGIAAAVGEKRAAELLAPTA
jgi:hypothetical protein